MWVDCQPGKKSACFATRNRPRGGLWVIVNPTYPVRSFWRKLKTEDRDGTANPFYRTLLLNDMS